MKREPKPAPPPRICCEVRSWAEIRAYQRAYEEYKRQLAAWEQRNGKPKGKQSCPGVEGESKK